MAHREADDLAALSRGVHFELAIRIAPVLKVCQHCAVGARHIAIFVGATTAAGCALLSAPVPSASAQPCPDVEVVFARGTTEAPGLGPTGDAFVDSLRSRIGSKSMEVYPVDYPATTDFPTATDGIRDASAHIESTAANCPNTNIVLGGFSRGRSRGGLRHREHHSGWRARRRAESDACRCGRPCRSGRTVRKTQRRFMRAINQPDVDVGPLYAGKTVELCVPDDFVCSSGRDFNAHTQYVETGMVDEAATITAARIAARPAPAASPQAPAPAGQPQAPAPAGQPHLPAPAAPPPAPGPAAPPLSTIPAAPPLQGQRAPEAIYSCTTVCRVIGPE